MYDEYLANGKHEFTDNGNMKPVPRRPVARCIIEVWGEVKREMVADLFKGFAVTTKWDRSEDEKISCFRDKKPCHHGKKLQDAQKKLLLCPSETEYTFEAPLKVVRKKPMTRRLLLIWRLLMMRTFVST